MSRPDLFLGVEIGGTKLQVVAGDRTGHISRRWRGVVDPKQGGPGICRQIGDAVQSMLAENQYAAIGVGFGGPIDVKTGEIRCSHQIAGWEDFGIRDWLTDLSKLPVAVENDANTAALGEAIAGAGKGLNPVFYVTLGSGVGGGLVVDGSIYHGRSPGEAEFGHVRLNPGGDTVESRCSGWAVDKRIREAIRREPGSQLEILIGNREGGEARHLYEAILARDSLAEEILASVTGDLGFALSHVVHLVHPSVIVLGGGLSLVGEALRQSVASALAKNVMKAFLPAPEVRLAGLGEDSVPVGALILASRAG